MRISLEGGGNTEELLNPRDMPPVQESEPVVSGVSASISLVEVTQVVKNSLVTRTQGWMRYAQKCLWL